MNFKASGAGNLRVHTGLIVCLALAASALSLRNGFALDDVHIIVDNARVHSLDGLWRAFGETYWPPVHGASLYRPNTIILFAFQWAAGGGSPFVFHLVSVTLYLCLSVAILLLARELMDERAAVVAAALFAVHPLHTEAFANVVGQAELCAALLLILALTIYMRKRNDRFRLGSVAGMCAIYVAALMFKEHAIVLPALILAAEVILPAREGHIARRARIRRVFPLIASMTILAAAFALVRTLVIGRFAGGSTATVFLGQGYSTRVFTMLNVMPEWLRLFLWPQHLSADYSPPRIETATSFAASMVPAVVVILALALIAWRIRKEHPAVTYGLVFAGITLLIPSNLVIVTGFVLAERALLLPSLGVALIVGYCVSSSLSAIVDPIRRGALMAATSIVLIAGVTRSYSRSAVWKDNETLFRHTVLDVPSSYRAHLMLGEVLTDAGNNNEGLPELATAVWLSRPSDGFVRWFAADRFHAAGQLHKARQYYEEAMALNPADQRVRYGLTVCLQSLGDIAGARMNAIEGLKRDSSDSRFVRVLGQIDSARILNVATSAAGSSSARRPESD